MPIIAASRQTFVTSAPGAGKQREIYGTTCAGLTRACSIQSRSLVRLTCVTGLGMSLTGRGLSKPLKLAGKLPIHARCTTVRMRAPWDMALVGKQMRLVATNTQPHALTIAVLHLKYPASPLAASNEPVLWPCKSFRKTFPCAIARYLPRQNALQGLQTPDGCGVSNTSHN